ncbi:hypothetical protein DFQ28_002617 [Apophysomyces sp. BC1034]|nr:hypothetical protein DFQ30_005624 [Apophysomyces sp. BC1015]KAG0190013.1 hypothetical protein DFQ28_002617 [Apophysomyces sp. BC1034]
MSIPLQEFIEGACSPARYEPDLALNLEICEMINKKQGNSPRETATTLVRLINSKNLNQSMMALTLLDNCVKNCGYPFHLQIATKEFLNELVRRFPERPAPFPSPVVQRILYLIKEWKVALADMSRHKDDLVHIKDMYRLLRFKGYRFPELRESSVAALAPSQTLKSAHELEEEDRVAQSAKLQELIRRGRPQDLVEANHLMKIMSGYDQRQKPNYKQKFEEELHKIQEKTILLYEMLESVRAGEKVDMNETIVELKQACSSAQPKIQHMITDEEDSDKIDNLLTLNDMINNAMAKFADIQKGLYETHYEISGKPPTKTNTEEEPRQAISLIDLDDQGPTSTAFTSSSGAQTPKQNVMDELTNLFGESSISPPPYSSSSTTATVADPFDFLSSQSLPSPAQQAVSPALSATSLSTPATAVVSSTDTNQRTNGNQQTIEHKPINLVNKNGLQITLEVSQVDSLYRLRAYFSNQSTAPMENLTLLLAAPKSMQLKMEPQSSQLLPPKSDRSVTQGIILNNPNKETLRLRYKVTYQQFGVDMEQTGTYSA